MQLLALSSPFFSTSLALLLVFGVLYAWLIRWASVKGIEGQTAWAVVIGVTVTLLAMIPTFGLLEVAIMFAFFAASGIPMIIEYILRVHKQQLTDKEKAQNIAKDLLQ